MTEHTFEFTNGEQRKALVAHNELCAGWNRWEHHAFGLAASRNRKKLEAAHEVVEERRKQIFEDTATGEDEKGRKQMTLGTPEHEEYERQVEAMLLEKAPSITLEVLRTKDMVGHTREADGKRASLGISGEALEILDDLGLMTEDGKPRVPRLAEDAEEGVA